MTVKAISEKREERLSHPVNIDEEYLWAILSELRAIRQMLEGIDRDRRGV